MRVKTHGQTITDKLLYNTTRKQRQRLRKIARSLDIKKIPKQIVIPTEYMVDGKK